MIDRPDQTRFERYIKRLKGNKIVAAMLLICAILAGFIAFTENAKKFYEFSHNTYNRFMGRDTEIPVAINFTEDMTLGQAIKMVAALAKVTPKLTNCSNKILNIKIEHGEIHAKSHKKLIEVLQYRLINVPKQFRYKVNEHKEERIYEIICEE
jgi:hypothetical protein